MRVADCCDLGTWLAHRAARVKSSRDKSPFVGETVAPKKLIRHAQGVIDPNAILINRISGGFIVQKPALAKWIQSQIRRLGVSQYAFCNRIDAILGDDIAWERTSEILRV